MLNRPDSPKAKKGNPWDLLTGVSMLLFIAAGVRMLTITAETDTIISDFIHAVGIFSIAMAAIPLLLRRK